MTDGVFALKVDAQNPGLSAPENLATYEIATSHPVSPGEPRITLAERDGEMAELDRTVSAEFWSRRRFVAPQKLRRHRSLRASPLNVSGETVDLASRTSVF